MLGLAKLSNDSGDLDLRPRERKAPRPGYVLLEVAGAGICGTDVHILKGEYKVAPPVTIGHEVCGFVCEVGEGVDKGRIGARVVSETFHSTCGKCRYCRGGRPNMCEVRRSIGTHMDGAMAPFVEVPETALHPAPDWLSDAAASMAEPLACVMNSTYGEDCHVNPDENVLVIGPGAIGLLAAQVARAAGATVTVRGTARDRARLDLAERLGFAVADARTLEDENRYDKAIECSGSPFGIADALRDLGKGGRLLQMGIMGRDAELPYDLVIYKELKISAGFATTPDAWRRAMKLMWKRAIDLEPLVTDVGPLKSWRALFDRSMAAEGVKFVFDPRLG